MQLIRRWLEEEKREDHATCLQRRRLLRAAMGGAALLAMPGIAEAALVHPRAKSKSKSKLAARALTFNHTHTGERLSLVYRVGDHYVPDAMKRIAYLMRDFRSGQAHPIDPKLMDLLWQVQHSLKVDEPFQIISAYRSPGTNAMLRGRSAHTGVAKDSLHLKGQAIDISLPGIALADVRDAALDMKKGGVGFYPDSGFVHVDTGRVRRW